MPETILNLKNVVVYFSPDVELKEIQKGEELEGKMSLSSSTDSLAHSVLENDQKTIDEGTLLDESKNKGISGFTANLMFEKMVSSYSMVRQIYGDKIIRLITGYGSGFVEKNIKIPEFQKELKKAIEEKINDLKQKKLLDKEGIITEKGNELSALVLAVQELDKIVPKGLIGKNIHKKSSHYGDKSEIKNFKKGDRFKDIAMKASVRNAIKHNHDKIIDTDLKVYNRSSKGSISIIYAIDASSSMKGDKIAMSKKAGIALAHNAIKSKDSVGLLVFSEEIKDELLPTLDFHEFLMKITKIKSSGQTSFKEMIEKATTMFPNVGTKHLIILTDALPTVGEKPEEDTMKSVSLAKSNGITVSMMGINLDSKGIALAKEIVLLGEGRFYQIKDLANMDLVVLEDYYATI